MRQKLRSHLSYANVMATIAVFIGLATGGAYASHLVVNSSDVVDESLLSRDVKGKFQTATTAAVNGALTGADISGQPARPSLGQPFVDGSLTEADIRNNTLTSDDIKNFSLGNGDFLDGSVDSRVVTDNSLTGADINEGSMGPVTSSVLGGLGRSGLRQNGLTGPGSCNPESQTFVNCDMAAKLDLPAPARVLVIGSVRARTEPGAGSGGGDCQLGTTGGPIPGSTAIVLVTDTAGIIGEEHVSIAGVTGVFPAGQQHAFGIDCNEFGGGIQYLEARVTAVALSDR